MTAQGIKPHLLKTKKLVLSGNTPDAISKLLGVSPRTVRNYINQLVFMGELVIIGPVSSTPRVYEDGKPDNPPYNYNPTDSQTTAENDKKSPSFKRGVPSTETVENFSTSGEWSKMVRFHCTGAWVVKIKALGDHGGVIRDSQGLTIGEWSQIVAPNNSRRQYGSIRLYPGEDMHFTLFLAKEGPKLTVTPCPRYVYYRGSNVTGPRALAEQVHALMDVLVMNGWKFDGIDNKSIEHYAIDTPDLAELLKLADRNKDPDNARVHVDTSNGTPEIEVYNDHPGAYEDVLTLYELPERIDAITDSLTAYHGALRALADNMGQLTDIVAKMAQVQAQTLPQYTAPDFDNRGYN